jgi:hypothetical protein
MPKSFAGVKRRRFSQSLPSTQFTDTQGSMGMGRRTYKRGVVRSLATRIPTFTETVLSGGANSNSGGLIQPRVAAIPELADYAALYRSYRVIKLEVIFMPTQVALTGSPSGMTQLAYAVDPSAELTGPASLTDVLNNNNVRLRQLDKPVRVSWRPVPSLLMPSATGGNAGVSLQPQWIQFDDGSNVNHNGITWWATNTGTSTTHNIYVKFTFQCKDPR